ncbi:unnamed protein product [Sphagnum jensenii]|uniref:Chlorophyll a-b binding protein, chloroplastic n=1 Tax=Sphagnum jensenii TaxID=128206 RepID=A0ABP0W7R2_9BRYO
MQHYISIAYRKALLGGFCFVEFGPVLRIFGLNPFVGTYPFGPVFLCLPVFEAGSFLDVETAQAAAAEEEDWLLKNQILLFVFVLKHLVGVDDPHSPESEITGGKKKQGPGVSAGEKNGKGL